MAYKPVGADEAGKFPPRVEAAIAATIDTQITDVAEDPIGVIQSVVLSQVKEARPPARRAVGSMIVFMYDDPENYTPDNAVVNLHIAKGIPASWGVTAANIDTANVSTRGHGYFTSAFWHNLTDNYGHELVNHSATHLNIRNVADASLEYEVNGALDILTAKGFKVDGFIYPNEDSGITTRRKVSERHQWAVGNLNGAVGNQVVSPLQTWTIGRRHLGADPVAAAANNRGAIDGAVNKSVGGNGQVLILWTHPYTLTTDHLTELGSLMDYAVASGLPVVTMGEAMRKLHNVYEAGDTYIDPVDGARPWTVVGADGVLRSSVLPVIAESSTVLASMTPETFTLGTITSAVVASTAGFPGATSGRVETDRRSVSSLQHRQIFIDTNSRMHIRHAANTTTWLAWREFAGIQTASTAALESAANAVNTTGKVLGKQILNSTTGVLAIASGSSATAVWRDAMAATIHTPV